MKFRIFVAFVSTIASITSSAQEFCKIKEIKSVFNIDEDIYFVDKVTGSFWRYSPQTNNFNIDKMIETIVSDLKFNVDKPIFGFKFSQIYECSKVPKNCDQNQNDFDFDGIEYCAQRPDYCTKAVELKDIIFLIGFNSESKQSYQALKRNSVGFVKVDELFPEIKANSVLSNVTFLTIDRNQELVSVIYRQSDYEMAMILKSTDPNPRLTLKLSSLKTPWWFNYWNQYKDLPIKNSIGLFQKGSDVFAVTPIDYSLYLYDIYGPQNSSRRFNETFTKLKTLFNCSVEVSQSTPSLAITSKPSETMTMNQTITTAPTQESSVTLSQNLTQTLTTTQETGGTTDNKDLNESIPETDPWILLVLPIIIIILIILTAIFAYYWFLKPKESDKQTKPQVKDIHNILNRDSN